jgi:hypothetical protein
MGHSQTLSSNGQLIATSASLQFLRRRIFGDEGVKEAFAWCKSGRARCLSDVASGLSLVFY